MGNLKIEREIHFTVVKNFRAKKFFAKLVDAKSFASSQQQQIFFYQIEHAKDEPDLKW